MRLTQEANFEVLKPSLSNIFNCQILREGSVVFDETIKNNVTINGINSMLNTMFLEEAQKSAWYLGLIDSVGFSNVDVTDTMSSHVGWGEFTTYSELVRQLFIPNSSTVGKLVSSTVSQFTIGTVATNSTLEGLFVTDSSAKGGTTGFLWATALFTSVADIKTGDIFRTTYTLNLGN